VEIKGPEEGKNTIRIKAGIRLGMEVGVVVQENLR